MVKLSVINELCQLLWLVADEEAAAAGAAPAANGAATDPQTAVKAEQGAGATDMDIDQQGQRAEAAAGADAEPAPRGGEAGGSGGRDLYVRQERVVLEEFLSIVNKLGETAAKKLATAQQQQQGQQQGAVAAGVTPGAAAAAAAAAGSGPFSATAAPQQQQGQQAGAALQYVVPGGMQPLPGGPAGTPPAHFIPVLAPPPRPGQVRLWGCACCWGFGRVGCCKLVKSRTAFRIHKGGAHNVQLLSCCVVLLLQHLFAFPPL